MSLVSKLKKAFTMLTAKRPVRPITVHKITVSDSKLLSGRCALVTGGTSRIGLAIVRAFVNAGADVIFIGRKQSRIDDVTEEFSNNASRPGKVRGVCLNVSDTEKIAETFRQLFDENHKIDILVNNAGILGDSFPSVSQESFDQVIATNLRGALFCSQEFVKNFEKYNPGQHANILNISSSSGLRPAISPYSLSKWGIRGLTLGLAKSLAPHNITVNAIAPGPTATPMLCAGRDSLRLPNSPIGRYILPEEIANMAVILVSRLCDTVVGDTLFMTGGAGVTTFDDIKYDINL